MGCMMGKGRLAELEAVGGTRGEQILLRVTLLLLLVNSLAADPLFIKVGVRRS